MRLVEVAIPAEVIHYRNLSPLLLRMRMVVLRRRFSPHLGSLGANCPRISPHPLLLRFRVSAVERERGGRERRFRSSCVGVGRHLMERVETSGNSVRFGRAKRPSRRRRRRHRRGRRRNVAQPLWRSSGQQLNFYFVW